MQSVRDFIVDIFIVTCVLFSYLSNLADLTYSELALPMKDIQMDNSEYALLKVNKSMSPPIYFPSSGTLFLHTRFISVEWWERASNSDTVGRGEVVMRWIESITEIDWLIHSTLTFERLNRSCLYLRQWNEYHISFLCSLLYLSVIFIIRSH